MKIVAFSMEIVVFRCRPLPAARSRSPQLSRHSPHPYRHALQRNFLQCPASHWSVEKSPQSWHNTRRDLLLRTLELFEDAAGAVGAAVHERWLHLAVGAVVHERRCALATGTGTAGASGGTVSGDRHLTLSIRNQITVALRIPGIKVRSSVCVRRAL